MDILNKIFYWTGLLSWSFTALIVVHYSLEPVRRFFRVERAVRIHLQREEGVYDMSLKRPCYPLAFAWKMRGRHEIEHDFPGSSKTFFFKDE